MKNVISHVAIVAPALQSKLPGEKASQQATYRNTTQKAAGCEAVTPICVRPRANNRNISFLHTEVFHPQAMAGGLSRREAATRFGVHRNRDAMHRVDGRRYSISAAGAPSHHRHQDLNAHGRPWPTSYAQLQHRGFAAGRGSQLYPPARLSRDSSLRQRNHCPLTELGLPDVSSRRPVTRLPC
jgi:hypothetical protein